MKQEAITQFINTFHFLANFNYFSAINEKKQKLFK